MKLIPYLTGCLIILFFIGCANIERSMVFSTGTTIGLEVAVSPTSEDPVDILIGYKRAEVLFDPIMNDKDTNADKGKRKTYEIRPTAHSVIAKLLGEMKTTGTAGQGPEAKAGLTVSQWFAAGKAAEIIAQNGGAAALTDDPKVAKEVAKATTLISEEGEIPEIVFSLTNQFFQAIKKLRTDSPSLKIKHQADQLFHSLNSSALVTKVPSTINQYIPGPKPQTPSKTHTFKVNEKTLKAIDFQSVITYRSNLSSSVQQLAKISDAILDGKIEIEDHTKPAATKPVKLDKDGKRELYETFQKQKKELDEWNAAMTKDPQFVAMWRFLSGS